RVRRKRSSRLKVETLEDRLTPTVAAGAEVPGQLLIGLQPGLTRSDVADLYTAYHLSELKNLDVGPDANIRLVATPTPRAETLIPTLEQDPRVRYAEPHGAPSVASVPNAPTLARDYGPLNTGQTGGTPDADTDADEAWDITTGSSDVIVAVIDTGVDYNHPD